MSKTIKAPVVQTGPVLFDTPKMISCSPSGRAKRAE
jgi:hypothetical protein